MLQVVLPHTCIARLAAQQAPRRNTPWPTGEYPYYTHTHTHTHMYMSRCYIEATQAHMMNLKGGAFWFAGL